MKVVTEDKEKLKKYLNSKDEFEYCLFQISSMMELARAKAIASIEYLREFLEGESMLFNKEIEWGFNSLFADGQRVCDGYGAILDLDDLYKNFQTLENLINNKTNGKFDEFF